MIVLVTGGSGSGKSEYAEQLVMRFGDCRRFYVATMEVFGEEGREKVLRHKRLRRGKGFVTLERQRNVGGNEIVLCIRADRDCCQSCRSGDEPIQHHRELPCAAAYVESSQCRQIKASHL